MAFKAEDEVNEGLLGENSLEDNIEVNQKGRSIEMGKLKIYGWIG